MKTIQMYEVCRSWRHDLIVVTDGERVESLHIDLTPANDVAYWKPDNRRVTKYESHSLETWILERKIECLQERRDSIWKAFSVKAKAYETLVDAIDRVHGDSLKGVHQDTRMKNLIRKGEQLKRAEERKKALEKARKERALRKAIEKETKKIMPLARKAIALVGVAGYTDNNGNPVVHNSPLDVYRGCGSYIVGWKDGKITCALHGSYRMSASVIGASCPSGVSRQAWSNAVTAVMSEHSDKQVRMDGSGTEFFFRDFEDADLVTTATEVYYVPNLDTGGLHLNIQPAIAEVVPPNQLTA